MTFPSEVADHHKQDMRQKCFYIITLIKAKSAELYEKFHAQYQTLKAEDSWDFYHMLVEEYKKLVDSPDVAAPAEKKVAKAPTKKTPAKKAAKAPAKKAPAKKAAKKAAKKVAKKAPAKKAAKKVAKKVTKKAVKKAPAKKVAKKAKKKK